MWGAGIIASVIIERRLSDAASSRAPRASSSPSTSRSTGMGAVGAVAGSVGIQRIASGLKAVHLVEGSNRSQIGQPIMVRSIKSPERTQRLFEFLPAAA